MGRVDGNSAHDTKLKQMQIPPVPLLNVETITSKGGCPTLRINRRRFMDTFFDEIGFGIDEIAKNIDTRDNVAAMWLPFVGWIASRLVRGMFIVFPNDAKMSGVPSSLHIWRSALQVRCSCLVVVPHGFS